MDHSNPQTVLVLGAGSWGAVLADLLARKGHHVRLWEYLPDVATRLQRDRNLPGKLDDFRLHESIQVSHELEPLADQAVAFVFATTCRPTRRCASALSGFLSSSQLEEGLFINVSKGLEQGSLARMSQVLAESLPGAAVCSLSGPSHAEEVCAGLPTTVVAGADVPSVAERVQDLFMTARFRVYSSDDLLGVELGGALKNVVAIAAGAAAGMGFGDNTTAALVTRGLAEISRLGAVMGANPLTFAGLSGLGDLVVTCASRHSRNRRLGIELARGTGLEGALQRIGMAVEGVDTARSVAALCEQYQVEMPIATQVAEVLFSGTPVAEAVERLMLRDPKPELHSA